MLRMARGLRAPLAAVGAAALLAALFLWALGADPLQALQALARGALGDARALENTLLRFCPLALVGLAVALAFRAGVWNIGAEGQLVLGALLATALATRALSAAPALVLVPALLAAGALGGALWGALAALLKTSRGVSEVLSTVLLNFVAALAVAWAVHGPLQEASGAYPQSDALPEAARLAVLPGLRRLHVGFLVALGALPLAWFVLFRTALGLRLRAVGLAPEAARYAGIDPARETARVLAASGALAGLAGAIEVAGVTGRLFENLSAGYGFSAIAVALLARLQPLAVLPAALFFAALATGSAAMQRGAAVPSVAVRVIEGLVILFSVGVALPSRTAR
jgi:simple sugar transport system permease protein